jgi:hypothetical protein
LGHVGLEAKNYSTVFPESNQYDWLRKITIQFFATASGCKSVAASIHPMSVALNRLARVPQRSARPGGRRAVWSTCVRIGLWQGWKMAIYTMTPLAIRTVEERCGKLQGCQQPPRHHRLHCIPLSLISTDLSIKFYTPFYHM